MLFQPLTQTSGLQGVSPRITARHRQAAASPSRTRQTLPHIYQQRAEEPSTADQVHYLCVTDTDLRTTTGCTCHGMPRLLCDMHAISAQPDQHAVQEWGVGLDNLGNTCFANAVLQCLAAIPQLQTHSLQHLQAHPGVCPACKLS